MVYTVLLDLVSVSSNILSLICLYLFSTDTLANVLCNVFRILVAPLRQVTGGVTQCNIPGRHVKYCYSVAICCKKRGLDSASCKACYKTEKCSSRQSTSGSLQCESSCKKNCLVLQCLKVAHDKPAPRGKQIKYFPLPSH